MTQRIVLFNGPPSCGKDTAALRVWEARQVASQPVSQYPWAFDRMSMPIKRAFAGMMGVPIDDYGNVFLWEGIKDQHSELLDMSYRDWQIAFSEEFMKDFCGDNIFARLFVNRARRQHSDAVILVPDCGFEVEYNTLVNAFGKENILVVKIFRPGCTFEGDSRQYLKIGSEFIWGQDDASGRFVAHLNNSGTKEEFEAKVLKTISEWLERSKE